MRKRVLFQQGEVTPFRRPFFRGLGEKYELEVAVSEHKRVPSDPNYTVRYLKTFRKFGFEVQKWSGPPLHEYDAIISMFDFRFPIVFDFFLWRRDRLVLFAMGYGGNVLANIVRRYMYSRSAAVLVYYDTGAQDLINTGIPGERVFALRNSVEVASSSSEGNAKVRHSILHVGTPRAAKIGGIVEVMTAFAAVKDELADDVKIVIVGPRSNAAYRPHVRALGLEERVEIHEEIWDEGVLQKMFSEALLYTSPWLMGLGAQHAMAYGVPILLKNTVGHPPEVSALFHEHNALFYRSPTELPGLILRVAKDRQLAERLGRNGQALFESSFGMERMIANACEAIEYVIRKNGVVGVRM